MRTGHGLGRLQPLRPWRGGQRRDGAYPCTQGIKTSLPQGNHPQHCACPPGGEPSTPRGTRDTLSIHPTVQLHCIPINHTVAREGELLSERGIACLGFKGDPVAETPASPPHPQSCPKPRADPAQPSLPRRLARRGGALLAGLQAERLIDRIIPYLLISSLVLRGQERGDRQCFSLYTQAVGV